MKILITGHMGYIGSYLVKKLNKEHDVIGIDIKKGNDIVNCNLPDVGLVIHLAAESSVIESLQNPIETVRTNVLGTVKLFEKYKNTKFIFASTGGAIQDEILSPYGLSKYCGEEFIKMLFNDYVILRFANVYGGEGSKSVIDKFINDKDIVIYGDGSQTRTFVYIDDLIEGIIKSMNWQKGNYYLGSDQNYTILELAQATKKPIRFENFRKGELLYSNVKNTAPNWNSTVNVINYIKSKL